MKPTAEAAILYSNGIAAQLEPRLGEQLFACPICHRSGLKGESALWSHIRQRHNPGALARVYNRLVDAVALPDLGPPDMPNWCEDALIRIANATTLDEATGIALSVLLRGAGNSIVPEVAQAFIKAVMEIA
jgi:hypothetical protein